MDRNLRALIVAAAVALFAAPAFADTLSCTVTAPEIRLRKSPSRGARVIAVLKRNTRLTAQKCAGGWVKVASGDGKLAGYVGGWALEATTTAATTTAVAQLPRPVVVQEAPAPAPQKVIPGNEQLAMQITELRLNVLGIEREMDAMKKDIRQMQSTVARRSHQKVPTVGSRKGRKERMKKG